MTKAAPLHTHWIDGRNDRKTETREKLHLDGNEYQGVWMEEGKGTGKTGRTGWCFGRFSWHVCSAL
jgi:hypothetical protein